VPLSTAYGENPENAVVTMSGEDAEGVLVELVQEVDEEGVFRFDDVPPGTYQVTASALWYESETRPFPLKVYAGTDSIIGFGLKRGYGTIEGRVLCGGRGIGIPKVQLDAFFAPDEQTPYRVPCRLWFAEDGSYSVEVDWGRWFVFVGYAYMFSWDSYNKTAPSLWVEPGDTVPHDIILAPLMEVDDITVSTETRLETRTVDDQVIETTYKRAKAIVTVRDWLGPLSGVEVNGHWSGAFSSTVSGITDGEDSVTFMTDWVEDRGGRYTFTVDGLEKTDWEYDEEGSETSSSSW